jgi:hypothetical protein
MRDVEILVAGKVMKQVMVKMLVEYIKNNP